MRVLITGAAGGIGRECVKLMAAKDNMEVIAISRSQKALNSLQNEVLKEYGKNIFIYASDFHIKGFEQEVVNNLNLKETGLQYLINNAGLLINKSFDEMKEEEVEEQMRINYTAPLLLIRSLMPYLIQSNSDAHVVNIGSMGGYQGSDKFPGLSAYSASKSALAILTECLAAEYAESPVKFNCLALGSANTSMLRMAFPDYESPMSPKKIAEFIVNFTLNDHHYFNGKVLPVAGTST